MTFHPRRQGFTLLEIVVMIALLSIMAFFVLPSGRWSGAQRNRVSRATADQRAMATALAAYFIDNNAYPLAMVEAHSATVAGNSLVGPRPAIAPARAVDLHPGNPFKTAPEATRRVTFAHPSVAMGLAGGFATLSTPISYLTTHYNDPFSAGGQLTFSYLPDRAGFLMASFGPHRGGSGDPLPALQEVMRNQFIDQATVPFDELNLPISSHRLRVGAGSDGGAYTYDPTNGAISAGAIYRLSD